MIGDNIKRIRELKGLGLNELARIANMNASYLSAIEQNKKTNPSVKTLKKIAIALNVFSEELFKSEAMSDDELKYYDLIYETRKDINIIPEEFTRAFKAREYIKMHQIFSEEGFNIDEMSDEDVLDFANALLEQMKMVGYKYKK